MKFVRIFLIAAIILNYTSECYCQNYKTEWINKDEVNITLNFWLANHDSVVISLGSVKDTILNDYVFQLEYWNLQTNSLMKTYDLKVDGMNGSTKLNTVRNEFFVPFGDSIEFRKTDDFSIFKKVKIPFSCSTFWYNYLDNQYCFLKIEDENIRLAKMNPETYQLIDIDTIQIPNPGLNIFDRISENGAYIVFDNGNNEFFVYDSKNFKMKSSIKIDALVYYTFSVSNSGKYLGINTAPDDVYPFRVYDIIDTNKKFLIPNHLMDAAQIKFASDDSKILIPTEYAGQYVYEMFNDTPIKVIKNSEGSAKAKFCLSNNSIIDIGDRKSLIINDINSNAYFNLTKSEKNGKNIIHKSVKFSNEADKFFVSGNEGRFSSRNISDGKIIREIENFKMSTSILNPSNYSQSDTIIIFSCGSGFANLFFYNIKTNKIDKNYDIDNQNIVPLKVSNDLKWFAAATYHKGTYLYNLSDNQSEKKIILLDSGREWNNGAAFSSDSRYLATGGTDNILRVYDLNNIQQNATPVFTKHYPALGKPFDNMGILNIAFIDNNTKIITSSFDFPGYFVWSAVNGDSLKNPVCPSNYYANGKFPTIQYFEYRQKYNDYFSVDNKGGIFIWNKDFEFKSYYTIKDALVGLYATSFDYNQETNHLLIGTEGNTTALIKLDDATDISENISQDNIMIYQNFESEYIEIKGLQKLNPQFGNKNIRIYNILGELVNKIEIDYTASNSQVIDISNLQNGMYILKIANMTAKFIK